MKTIDVVVAILINDNNEILLCERQGKYDGYWEFPGGKVEKNESLTEALTRELHEELNIWIYAFDFFDISINQYAEGVFKVHFFISKYDGLIVSNVHKKICWVNLKNALNFKLLKNTDIIIKKLEEVIKK